MKTAIERGNPTGGEPAGLQDTAIERILNIPPPPCKRNILHDPHECRCAAPCPACSTLKAGEATRDELRRAVNNLIAAIEEFRVVAANTFHSRMLNIAASDQSLEVLNILRGERL